jgi:predicted transcriptional regulator of viral defense system
MVYTLLTMKAQQYLDYLTSEGRISFTKEALQQKLGLTSNAANCMIRRLKQKQKIASPAKGYYLVLAPEFRSMGCLPPDFFIDDLMEHLGLHYYAALISAALYHGAAHQQPQIFQVMVSTEHTNIQCGRVRIQFITNHNLDKNDVISLNTRTGVMRVATPETTAKDLLLFIRQSGGIGRVATVIDELAEVLNKKKLQALAKKSEQLQWVQRLGYVLEKLKHLELAESLFAVIQDKNLRITPLVPYRTMTRFPRDNKWRIAINANVESDLNDDTN